MTIRQRKSMAAFTLTEVMAAILIVVIVIAGGSFLFVMGRSQITLQKSFRVANQLAAQKLEEWKAATYASIPAGDTEENVTPEDITYTRSTHVDVHSNPSYKEATVTVSWQHKGNERSVSLVTCIAP
jgi:type II secretory pathway pseudopilin PulG